MGRAHRTAGVLGIVAITAVGLTGCIPGPPPIPQLTPTDPIVQGDGGTGEVREGLVPADGTTEVPLQLDERSAVVIGAISPDGEDLTLHLTGAGTDLENDDSRGELDIFEFELDTRDPALATVLEPGDYTIEVGEWGGDSSSFRLQVITSATTVAAGTSTDLAFGPGQPAIVIVPLADGSDTITATSDEDTTLWAYLPESGTEYSDDDSGGGSDPLLELRGESPQDIVVVATGYSRDDSGTVQLSVD